MNVAEHYTYRVRWSAEDGEYAVSYTHLDVYKRQPTSRGACVPPGPSKWAMPELREGKCCRSAATS